MKKFFAGVSVLAVVVGGLAGCGNNAGVSRESVQQKYYEQMSAQTPENLKGIPNYDELLKCMSEKVVADFDDKQLADFDKLLGKSNDKLTIETIPDEFKPAMQEATAACRAEYLKGVSK